MPEIEPKTDARNEEVVKPVEKVEAEPVKEAKVEEEKTEESVPTQRKTSSEAILSDPSSTEPVASASVESIQPPVDGFS